MTLFSLSSSRDIVQITDHAGRFVYCNVASEKILLYGMDDLNDVTAWDVQTSVGGGGGGSNFGTIKESGGEVGKKTGFFQLIEIVYLKPDYNLHV